MEKHRYLPPKKGNPRNIFGAKYENGFYYIAECTCGLFATGNTRTAATEKLIERHQIKEGPGNRKNPDTP
ncbi:MAG: hypothetical protein ABIF87_12735 [Pseudomonadota bacterium]